jgi:hypothetical protein
LQEDLLEPLCGAAFRAVAPADRRTAERVAEECTAERVAEQCGAERAEGLGAVLGRQLARVARAGVCGADSPVPVAHRTHLLAVPPADAVLATHQCRLRMRYSVLALRTYSRSANGYRQCLFRISRPSFFE